MTTESRTASAWRELQTLLGIALTAAYLYWLWRARSRDQAVFILLLLTAISYVPISGLIPLNANVAEHWLYLPSAFFFLAATLTLMRLVATRRVRLVAAAVAAVWILFLGARTFVRTFDWKDQRTFLERTIASGGDSARMLINLGGLESNEGRLDLAQHHLERALQKAPEQPLGVIHLASVAVKRNDFKAAHELLARALDMPLVVAQAHELLAILESKETGHINLLRLRLATRSGAPSWAIEKRYIKALDETGGTDRAIAELQQVLKTQWYRADSWRLLGELLQKAGDSAAATEALRTAHRYDVHLSTES